MANRPEGPIEDARHLTREQKLDLINKHFEKHGNAAWEGVEAFRIKHRHLPSESDAPCKDCFNERTEAIIKTNQLEAELAASREREAENAKIVEWAETHPALFWFNKATLEWWVRVGTDKANEIDNWKSFNSFTSAIRAALSETQEVGK